MGHILYKQSMVQATGKCPGYQVGHSAPASRQINGYDVHIHCNYQLNKTTNKYIYIYIEIKQFNYYIFKFFLPQYQLNEK